MSDAQLNQWTIDFAQAKIALRNLEVLVHTSATYQTEAVSRLKELFTAYGKFAVDGASTTRSAEIAEQINLLSRVERNMHISTSKFEGKAKAQIESARVQVSALYAALGKLRSMKPPQYLETSEQLKQQIPSFLDLFDSFLARFTLQIRLQQADFYKSWGDAFTHAGRALSVTDIRDTWHEQFNQIMPALEVMKSVNPHVKATTLSQLSSTDQGRVSLGTEKVDSVLLAPVKWIHSKISKDLKHFQFSDPRMGFFNKPTQPPAHEEEKVKALFDFSGETDSDLSFKKGDIIGIVDKGTEDDPNWWCGELNGRRGLFPRNYVTDDMSKDEPNPDEYIPRVEKETEKVGSDAEVAKGAEGVEGAEDAKDVAKSAAEAETPKEVPTEKDESLATETESDKPKLPERPVSTYADLPESSTTPASVQPAASVQPTQASKDPLSTVPAPTDIEEPGPADSNKSVPEVETAVSDLKIEDSDHNSKLLPVPSELEKTPSNDEETSNLLTKSSKETTESDPAAKTGPEDELL